MRDRYANKSPFMQILHKYTGYITMGTLLVIIAAAYLVWDSDLEEFEKFTCKEVYQYERQGIEGLTDDQLVKWNQVRAECEGVFTPP